MSCPCHLPSAVSSSDPVVCFRSLTTFSDVCLLSFEPFHFLCSLLVLPYEDEATETELKSQLLHQPDLLSHVSDMKQDLIKMSAILTADATAKSHPVGGGLEKGTVDVSGEPLEIMEKDLERVKEDLEKVSEILKNGTFTGGAADEGTGAAEDWVLLTDPEVQEARKMAALESQEPVLRENRGNRGAPRPKAIKDSGDLQEYLLDVPVSSTTRGQRGTAQAAPQEVASGESKKPGRRTAKDPGQAQGSADMGALLQVPEAPPPASPVSPLVEETPIGSIKDKVKALQQKVEAEQKSRRAAGSKTMTRPPPKSQDASRSTQSPRKGPAPSPQAQSEKLEETMSVRELMQAFQTGQDPSKRKSGLFELKTDIPKPGSTRSKAKGSSGPVGREVSLDSKLSQEEPAPAAGAGDPAVRSGLAEPAHFGSAGLDESSNSLKHEGGADSLSSGAGTPHMSSEDSYKHQGLATPGTSPESMSSPPKTGQDTATTLATTSRDKAESRSTDEGGAGTPGDHVWTGMVLPVSSRGAADDHASSESCCVQRSECRSKGQELTKRVSETVETFLSDGEESPERQLELPTHTFSLPLKQDSEVLSPLADDSLTISHRDSLEGSPLPEENSSHQSPDSIEPSPSNESPPHDSLESSPVAQRSHVSLSSPVNPPGQSSSHPEAFKPEDLPQALWGLPDPEASAEQTSERTSSGKSPLSPDTPSSEEVSYQVNPKPPDQPATLPPSKPPVIPEDPEEGHPSHRKVTPEEEMFKMAARIKTFDEMEQDARSQKNSRQDLAPCGASGERLEPSIEKTLQSASGLSRAAAAADVDLSVAPHVKVQPPSPFSAGLHEGFPLREVQRTTAAARVTSEGQPPVSHLHLTVSHQPNERGAEKVSSGTKSSVTANSQNRTDEQKEQSLKRSRETSGGDREGAGAEGGPPQKDSNVTDEMKGDRTGAAPGQTGRLPAEDHPEEDEEAQEPPKTESKGVTARVEAPSWSAMREDDAAFAARVKEEEQKILNLVVDRQSQQDTPDTTPGRTPTEDSTPTSEPNPFLFQEGKLFEMTRSGAIDMTKRSYEEEGGGFAFFQIGEHPLEEPASEDVRQGGAGAKAETEVGLNLTLEVKTEEPVKSKDRADAPRRSGPDVDQPASMADASKSKIPKMGISASAKLAKKDQTAPEGVQDQTEKAANDVSGGVDAPCPDQFMTNMQTAETAVTRSVYPPQSQESSDSSPEETKSVMEATKAAAKSKQAPPTGAKKVPGKTQAKAAPTGRPKSAGPSSPHATAPSATVRKESLSSDTKSKIPIKAGGVKADSPSKRVESNQGPTKLKVPMKKEPRRKSEADAGPSVAVKTPSSKAKSFCEGESSRPAARKGAESAKSRSFHSRLPVRGKSGQTSVPSTATKEKSERPDEPIEFYEEISDEAARLVQAEADREQGPSPGSRLSH